MTVEYSCNKLHCSCKQPKEPTIDLAWLKRKCDWSLRTFGPGQRAKGVIEHIKDELKEIEEDPSNVTEWMDVVLLALDGAWREGHSPEAILNALLAKQVRNESRTWPPPGSRSPNEPYHHVEVREQITHDPEVLIQIANSLGIEIPKFKCNRCKDTRYIVEGNPHPECPNRHVRIECPDCGCSVCKGEKYVRTLGMGAYVSCPKGCASPFPGTECSVCGVGGEGDTCPDCLGSVYSHDGA